MSLRDTLVSEVERLAEQHEKNRQAYRDALKAQSSAAAAVRKSCEVASQSANELSAAKTAVAELDRTAPARVIGGSGNVQASNGGAGS